MKENILIICVIVIVVFGMLFIFDYKKFSEHQKTVDLILQDEFKQLEKTREIRKKYEQENQECRDKNYKDCIIKYYL